MDLSLRTFVNGWKAIYLYDVTCINEVRCLCAARPHPCSCQELPIHKTRTCQQLEGHLPVRCDLRHRGSLPLRSQHACSGEELQVCKTRPGQGKEGHAPGYELLM